MKVNLKRIFTIISLIVLATICLQVYWNYKNYLSNKVRLKNEVQIAYDNAIETYFYNDSKETFISIFSTDSTIQIKDFIEKIKTDSIFGKKFNKENKRAKLPKNNLTQISIEVEDVEDAIIKDKSDFLVKKDSMFFQKKIISKNSSDSLKKSTSNFTLENIKIKKDSRKKPIAFERTASIYFSDELKNEKKSTITILKGKKAIDSIGGIEQFPNNITMSFKSDSLKYEKLDSIFKIELNRKSIVLTYEFKHFKEDSLFYTYLKNNKKLPFVIKSNSTYLKSNETINVNYNYSNGFLAKRMSNELILSLLFSLAVIGCLYFLLFIIKKQKKIDEIKNDFINNITHEFKTPITTIATALEGMSTFNPENDSVKNQKYIAMSFNQLHRLENMVEKILETATLNANELQLNVEQIDLVIFIKSIVKKHQDISSKQIDCSFEKEELFIKGDSFYLENAISNLIDNAIKYGGKLIEINCHATEKSIQIDIKDNGNSILKSQEKLVFEKFYRIPKGNIHDVKGYGIGLYYAKTILEKHNGSIALLITEDTIFRITLPNEN